MRESLLEGWGTFFGGLGGFVLSVVAAAKLYYRNHSNKRNIIKARRMLYGRQECYMAMNSLVDGGLCDRAIVFCAHDSGDWMRPQVRCFATAIMWVDRDPDEQVSQYTELPVDFAYNTMLCKLFAEQVVPLDTATMKPSLLRGIYEAAGVSHSQVHLLGVWDGQMYYVSFARSTKHGPASVFDDVDTARFGMAANLIRIQLEKSHSNQ